jgi:putative inorganic carbon (HCO3(-)) transporter
MPIRDIVVIALTIISLPICLARPFFGILVWTVIALLNPHRFAWAIAHNQLPVAMLVGAVTLAGFLLFFPGLKGVFTREACLLIVLWIWFTITSLHNTNMPIFAPFEADTWFRWRFVSKIFLMTLVTVALVNTWERLRIFLFVMAGSLGLLVAKAIPFMIVTGGSFRLYGPDGSALDDNNALGLGLVMTLPMFLFLAKTESSVRLKWLCGIVFAATIPAIFFTYSRGAFIALAFVLLLMLLRMRQKALLIPILVVAALFAVYLTPEKWQRRMDFSRQGALIDDSALSRINAWTYSWRLARDYPLTGGGFEAFTPALFRLYAPNPKDVHGAHSIYFSVLAEHGFIGLCLYLLLLASSLMSLGSVGRRARLLGDDRAAYYAVMLQLSIVAFMIGGAFLGRAYFDYFYMIIACTIILKRLCRLDATEILFEPEEVEEQMA